MTEEDNCPPKMLQGGISIRHPIEIHKGGKYSPQGIGGVRPSEGDTHGDAYLEVPDCPEM